MATHFTRTFLLVGAMALGVLIPQANVFASAIRWLVIAMLFLVFLQTRISRAAFHRSHATLLAANVGMGLLSWGLGWIVGGREVAQAAFFAGITPTAIAAPVITSFLRGRVDYVIAAFVLTNVCVAAMLPVLLPIVVDSTGAASFAAVFGSVVLVVFAPALAAMLVRRLYPAAESWPARLRGISFGLWVVALFLVSAHSSEFIRHQATAPQATLFAIAGTSLAICVANFAVGYFIGGKNFRREASQSLGQKNTTFTIYLALAYASPLVALGPTFYVIWHNLWNAWQLQRARSGRMREA